MFKGVIDNKYEKELYDVISENKSHLRKWLSNCNILQKKLAGAIEYHKIDRVLN